MTYFLVIPPNYPPVHTTPMPTSIMLFVGFNSTFSTGVTSDDGGDVVKVKVVVECEDNPYWERVINYYIDADTGEVTFRFNGTEGFHG